MLRLIKSASLKVAYHHGADHRVSPVLKATWDMPLETFCSLCEGCSGSQTESQ